MTKTTSNIRFKAKLLRPAEPPKEGSWTFLILPKDASAKLPTRGMTTVEGIINGHPFRATLEPDGQKSHWLKVNKKMREAAGAEVGDVVPLEILSVRKEPEPRVPADLRKALAAAPQARAVWSDLTPIARRDWTHWITSAKRSGSTMLAKCSLRESDACAALIGLDSIVGILALPRRRTRRRLDRYARQPYFKIFC
jgi:hypothetical protein